MAEVPGEHLTHPSQLGQLSLSSIPPHSAMLLSVPVHFFFILKTLLLVKFGLHEVPRDPMINRQMIVLFNDNLCRSLTMGIIQPPLYYRIPVLPSSHILPELQ